MRVCYALLRACTVKKNKNVKRMKIFLDAYDWRAHIGFMETQEDKTMVKLIETQTLIWQKSHRNLSRRH